MVMTSSQWAEYIKTLILGLDSRLDVSFGPVVDGFITPSSLVFADIDAELDRVRKIVSIDNYSLMTDDEFNGIIGNYLISLITGTKASGLVYFQTPTLTADVTIPRGFPLATDPRLGPQVVFVTTEEKTMLVASAASYFNAAIGVYEITVSTQCTQVGDIGLVPAGSVNIMLRGLTGINKVTNRANFTAGRNNETREGAVDRLKRFLKSSGSLSIKEGIALDILQYVDDVYVIGSSDAGFDRDDQDSGAVDAFIIGTNLVEITDYFRDGYKYLEDPANGYIWYFENQPVDSLVEVKVDSVDHTSWFEVKKDTGVYAGSVRGKDVLYIADPGDLANYLALYGKPVEVKYNYNGLVLTMQNIYSGDDKKVFGRDLLIREASQADAVITVTLVYMSGYDKISIKAAVKTAVINYVNGLGIGDNLELADVIFVIKSIPGVDNLVFSDFRRSTDPGGTVADLVANSNEYFRTSSTLVTVA